ncbi:MAG: OmpA family protein, partial [Bacteroidetes bacterium]|nr:OmpA family protein [Bacteroidota bacterium]
ERDELIDQALIESEGAALGLKYQEEKPTDYQFNKLAEPVNSEFNDYAAAIYTHDSSLMFTSGRLGSRGRGVDPRYGESFTDFYFYEKSDQLWTSPKTKEKFKIINTKWNDGVGTFNYQKDQFYFTSCNNQGQGLCKIYVSKLVNGRWQEPIMLNEHINTQGTESKHPAVSPGGDSLFFVSNRPNGFGGLDIWMSISAGNDHWGPPRNLGETINTLYDEISPFYHASAEKFFFSSNGHVGFGGQDIFMVQGNDYEYADIVNLGPIFNSNGEDCYFSLGHKQGYLSSNRGDALGKFDIYNLAIGSLISDLLSRNEADNRSRVLSSRRMRLTGSGLAMRKDEDQLYYENLTAEEKALVDRLIDNELAKGEYFSQVGITKLEKRFFNRLSNKEKEFIEILARRQKAQEMSVLPNSCLLGAFYTRQEQDFNNVLITGLVLNKKNNQPASSLNINLSDDQGGILKITTTNDQGEFRFSNLELNRHYNIMLDDCEGKQPEYLIKDIVKSGYDQLDIHTEFENIYFDLDRYTLRGEAKKILTELAAYHHRNTEVQIEIFAYTDSLGSDDYNLKLSEKRGQRVVNYLIQNGVDRTGLVIWAKGKSSPVASNDDPIGRQFNRRVEFNITGGSESVSSPYTTYITRKAMSVETLALELGLNPEEIEKINGINFGWLEAHKPIRLPKLQQQNSELLFHRPQKRNL